jgi:O-antigen ligase
VFGHNFVNFDLGPLPLTVDRLILGGLIGAYVVQWGLRRVDPKPWTWVEYALCGFILVLLISTFTHDWHVDKPGKISPLWLLVAGYITPVMIYFFARDARLDARYLVASYVVITLLGLYLAVTGLAEVSRQWWAVFPKYIADPKLGIHYGRARGPMLQSHSLGFYLAVGLLCAWAWWRTRKTRESQLMLMTLFPLFLTTIFFTYTRCVWLGAALALFVVMCLTFRGAWRPLALTATLGVGLVVAVVAWDDIVGIEREAGSVAARDSVSQRAAFTYVSWAMFLDRPLFGFGFGQFTQAKRPYLSDRSTDLYLEAIRLQPHHNTFLSLLTEVGLVGLGLYLAVLVGWARRAWRLARDAFAPPIARTQGVLLLAALAFYLGPATFFDLTYSPNDHWVLFFLAGLTVGLRPSSAAPPPPGEDDEALARRRQLAATN